MSKPHFKLDTDERLWLQSTYCETCWNHWGYVNHYSGITRYDDFETRCRPSTRSPRLPIRCERHGYMKADPCFPAIANRRKHLMDADVQE